MAKVMQMPEYSRYSTQDIQIQQDLLAKPASRRNVKIGPLLLISCLILAIFLVLLVPMVVGGAAFALSAELTQAPAQSVKLQDTAPKAKDFEEYKSAEDAAAALGLQAALPKSLPEGVLVTGAKVYGQNYVELGLAHNKGSFILRLAPGKEDLSFIDYDEFSYTATEDVNGVAVGYVGVSEKKFNAAVWTNNNSSYTLVFANGLEADVVRQFVAHML